MFDWLLGGGRDPRAELLEAEQRLLAEAGTAEGVTFDVFDVDLPPAADGSPQHLHTVRAVRQAAQPGAAAAEEASVNAVAQPPLVLVHGYGQGAASFYRNQAGLAARLPRGQVLAIDWLGCGGSSRPPWTATSCEEAEAFFVDSLEAWRAAMELDQVHLLGHSMGAIIATSFAERYPSRVASLVLASPAGVPEPPKVTLRERVDEMPFSLRRMVLGTAVSGWESGWTPHGLVRGSGSFLGRRIINGYVYRRFDDNVALKPEFAEYMYQLFTTGNQSGEHCLGCMLLPGAFARRPLCRRLPKLQARQLVFIYGDRDWMDMDSARQVREAMRAERPDVAVVVHELPRAGHQLFLDNPVDFNDIVLGAIEAYKP